MLSITEETKSLLLQETFQFEQAASVYLKGKGNRDLFFVTPRF
jgi:hypothetical protein